MSGILDELSFAPANLSKYVWEYPDASPDLSCSIGAKGSERKVALQLPFLCRRLFAERIGSAWPDFCQVIREAGVAIACPVDSLSNVPAAAVPIRLTRQHQGSALDAMEVATADLIEFSLSDLEGVRWGMPQEIRKVGRLGSFLSALREAAAGNTPIGVEIPLGLESEDIELICQSGVDFLTLSYDGRFLGSPEFVSAAVVQVAKQIQNHDSKLILDLPMMTEDHMSKYLALGVDLICIDQWLDSVLPEDEEDLAAYSAGRLSSLGVASTPTRSAASDALAGVLSAWKNRLSEQLQFCGVANLADFNLECLRAGSEKTQSLTGATQLG